MNGRIRLVADLSGGFPGVVEVGEEWRKDFRTRPSALFQVDYDAPGLARTFGWNGKVGRERKCRHWRTDGTVDCPDCGRTASEFIEAAQRFIDRNDRRIVDNPGYELDGEPK